MNEGITQLNTAADISLDTGASITHGKSGTFHVVSIENEGAAERMIYIPVGGPFISTEAAKSAIKQGLEKYGIYEKLAIVNMTFGPFKAAAKKAKVVVNLETL